jgi:hypothetical protein
MKDIRLLITAGCTALLLVVGILIGVNLSRDTPAQTTESEQSITVGLEGYPQTPIERIPVATPEATLLMAIDLMKPSFADTSTVEAARLADDLLVNGFYYWTTYPDGSERINYTVGYTPSEFDIEILVNYNGVILDAAIFGKGTKDWGVYCQSAISNVSTVDQLNYLVAKTELAARWWNADQSCEYVLN